MQNYTYIVVNANGTIINSEDYKYIYDTIILKFHYPICLNVTLELSESEKNAIKTDEFKFVKSRMPEHVKIYQIPRILYDLFLILQKYTVLYETALGKYIFNNKQDYESYCEVLNIIQEQISNDIWELNNFIIEYLKNKGFNFEDATYLDYSLILNSTIRDYYFFINVTYLNLKQNYYKTKKREFTDFVKEHVERLSQQITYISSVEKFLGRLQYPDISYIDKQYIMTLILNITQHLKDDPDISRAIFLASRKPDEEETREICEIITKIAEGDIVMEEIITTYNTSYAINSFMKFLNDLEIKLLHKVLIQEMSAPLTVSPTTKTKRTVRVKNKTTTRNIFIKKAAPSTLILYRGAVDTKESAIYNGSGNQGYSISYNTSVLNGIIFDSTACTYNFMKNNEKYREIMYKHKYILSRFFYGDDSSENNLFFIPPFHPYLQMISSGEFWHARSKIYTGSTIFGIQKFNNLFKSDGIAGFDYEQYLHSTDIDKDDYVIPAEYYENFPDYLTSSYTRDQIKTAFKRFIKMHRSKVQDNEQLEHVESELFGGTRKMNRII